MLGSSPSASSIMSYSSRLTASTPVFAIKIIDQAHLIAERKVKYAHIERDALVRLSARPANHTRGSSYGSVRPKNNRKSTASLGSVVAQVHVGGEHARRGSSSTVNNRNSVATNGSDSSATMSIPSIAVSSNGPTQHRRRPSQADPASTIVENGNEEQMESLKLAGDQVSIDERRPRERSSLPVPGPSAYNSPQPSPKGRASHPGIVRLHQTFADKTSLCKFWSTMASADNQTLFLIWRVTGSSWVSSRECVTVTVRKSADIVQYGSLDMFSARYYAAQLIDTIEFMHERGVIHRDIKPEK